MLVSTPAMYDNFSFMADCEFHTRSTIRFRSSWHLYNMQRSTLVVKQKGIKGLLLMAYYLVIALQNFHVTGTGVLHQHSFLYTLFRIASRMTWRSWVIHLGHTERTCSHSLSYGLYRSIGLNGHRILYWYH